MSNEQPGEDEQDSGSPSAATEGGPHDDPSQDASDPGADSVDQVRRADPESLGAYRGLDKVGNGESEPDDELDPVEEIEGEIVDAVDRRARQAVRREIRQISRSYKGPIPHAAELKAYEEVLPGAADRIVSMAENALAAQIDVDTTLAHGDVGSIKRGQWQSTTIVGGSLLLAFGAVVLKAPWEAVAVFAVPGIFEFGSSLVRAVREPKKESEDKKESEEG